METNNIFSKVKENWSVLLFIAPFLGGCYQIFELTSISVSFIRFFSVSQLLPDGILVLSFLYLFFYSPILYMSISYKQEKNSESLLLYFFKLLTFFSITSIGVYFNFSVFKEDKFYWNILLFTPLILFSVLKYSNFSINLKKKIIFLVFCSSIFIFPFIYGKFRELIYLPNNLINNLISVSNIKNEFKECANLKLLYYNDKYVFLELTVKKKKIIQIVKFDDYFFPK